MLRARQPALGPVSAGTTIDADLSATLGAATLASDVTVANPVTADLTATLGTATLSSDVSVASPITADLTATLGAATLASDVQVGAILIDDTHDGDYLRKKLKAERKALKRRRQQVISLYERLVEGKEPPPAVVEVLQTEGIAPEIIARQATAPEYDRMIAALERAVELNARLQIEADDEEVLLLI